MSNMAIVILHTAIGVSAVKSTSQIIHTVMPHSCAWAGDYEFTIRKYAQERYILVVNLCCLVVNSKFCLLPELGDIREGWLDSQNYCLSLSCSDLEVWQINKCYVSLHVSGEVMMMINTNNFSCQVVNTTWCHRMHTSRKYHII